MKLTPMMSQALEQAASQGELRRTHHPEDGPTAWPASPSTLAALVRHGCLEHSRRRNRHGTPMDIWTATDTGRNTLNPPPPPPKNAKPLYLRRNGGYTTIPAHSIDRDPIMGAIETHPRDAPEPDDLEPWADPDPHHGANHATAQLRNAA